MNYEAYRERFFEITKKLKLICPYSERMEVSMTAGLVMISCFDKYASSYMRAVFKNVNVDGGELMEFRAKNGFSCFVWVCEDLVISKPQIRKLALAA